VLDVLEERLVAFAFEGLGAEIGLMLIDRGRLRHAGGLRLLGQPLPDERIPYGLEAGELTAQTPPSGQLLRLRNRPVGRCVA
jgi:hypothetical protein